MLHSSYTHFHNIFKAIELVIFHGFSSKPTTLHYFNNPITVNNLLFVSLYLSILKPFTKETRFIKSYTQMHWFQEEEEKNPHTNRKNHQPSCTAAAPPSHSTPATLLDQLVCLSLSLSLSKLLFYSFSIFLFFSFA